MPTIDTTVLTAIAFYALSALLLAYASYRLPNSTKRTAARASLATICGATYFMYASYDGRDSWWSFDRLAQSDRRTSNDRGHAEFDGNEGSQSARQGRGGGGSGSAAGSGSPSGENGGVGGTVAGKLAALLPARAQAAARGDLIADCEDCPDLVVVDSGFYRMGAVPGDPLALDNERPGRVVMVRKRFAIGRTEVTIGQYAAFVRETGHKTPTCGFTDPVRDARLPLDCVSWRDAVAYTRWLSAKSSKSFRLPSEAEWQYAARGGATTRFATGENIGDSDANLAKGGPNRAPVGSYAANGFGMRDVHGSVAELVGDCWSDAPAAS